MGHVLWKLDSDISADGGRVVMRLFWGASAGLLVSESINQSKAAELKFQTACSCTTNDVNLTVSDCKKTNEIQSHSQSSHKMLTK